MKEVRRQIEKREPGAGAVRRDDNDADCGRSSREEIYEQPFSEMCNLVCLGSNVTCVFILQTECKTDTDDGGDEIDGVRRDSSDCDQRELQHCWRSRTERKVTTIGLAYL